MYREIDGVLRPGGLQLTKRLIDACGFPLGAKVLDIGCGSGKTVHHLCSAYGVQGVGVDLSAEALETGREAFPGLKLIQASAARLPFSQATFEGVISECSLSIMQYQKKTLMEMNRILIPGGKLALSDLYLRRDKGKREEDSEAGAYLGLACFRGARTRTELMGILEENGFRLLLWEDQSDCLKSYLFSYIMKYGSMEDFRIGRGGQLHNPIGYYLLVAEKAEGSEGGIGDDERRISTYG